MAGLNVRPVETVSCTITSLDITGASAIATPADFQTPVVVGGHNVSSLTQGSGVHLVVFTVVSPSNIGQAFTVTGRLANGTNFVQGPLALSVGKCKLLTDVM